MSSRVPPTSGVGGVSGFGEGESTEDLDPENIRPLAERAGDYWERTSQPSTGNQAIGGILPVTPTAAFTRQATDPVKTAQNFVEAPENVAEGTTEFVRENAPSPPDPGARFGAVVTLLLFFVGVVALGQLFNVNVGNASS